MLRKRILDAFECFNQSHKRSHRLSASGTGRGLATEDYSLDQLLARADALMRTRKEDEADSRRFASESSVRIRSSCRIWDMRTQHDCGQTVLRTVMRDSAPRGGTRRAVRFVSRRSCPGK